jgi:hypothetical protein
MTKPSVHGFTKMPNWLFLRLPELSPAGMRVTMVILAESVGWGVEAVLLSRTDFMRLSGLVRSAVRDGIQDALQRQVIERVPYHHGFAYRLKHPTDTAPFPWHSLRQAIRGDPFDPDAQGLATQVGAEQNTEDDLACDSIPPQNEALATSGPEISPEGAEFQPSAGLNFSPEGTDIRPHTGSNFGLEGAEFQPGTGSNFSPEGVEFQPGGTENQPRGGPNFSPEGGRISAHLSAINDGENSDLRVPKELIQDNTQELCEHTHNGTHSPRARARPPCVCASRYRYDEVLSYAESLKGIRNPGGLAVVYWRSGEMDEEIARFQQRQAEIAARKAEEEAAQRDELRALALELRTRGEPLAEWEREIIAVFADEIEEEHDVQIHGLDAADGNLV